MTTMQTVFTSLLFVHFLKSIMGLRFPWEICQCCKGKIGEHQKIQ